MIFQYSCFVKIFFSGCQQIINNSKGSVDFSQYQLKITYNAAKTSVPVNPQLKFFYALEKFAVIGLPVANSRIIKWESKDLSKWEALPQDDKDLTDSDTWTFVVKTEGRVTLTSQRGVSYTHQFSDLKGGNTEIGFADFDNDGVSCYEIYDPNPPKPSKILID